MRQKRTVPVFEERFVCYYQEGWRYGYLTEVKGSTAITRPIAAYRAALPRTIRVPLEDVRDEPQRSS